MLSNTTTCIFYGNNTAVIQRMLDYDYLCGRSPSVAAIMVNDNNPRAVKLFWGDQEILIPQINTREACASFGATVLINYASLRTAPTVIKQSLEKQLFAFIFTVAEGISEKIIKELNALQTHYPQTRLIGPSVVSCIIPGALCVGKTGGSWENVMKSYLRRTGSVGLVSKSGGMMNEMYGIISSVTDGIHSAFQLGEDRFCVTRLRDVMVDYELNRAIKIIVVVGEVSNDDEKEIIDLITNKKIKKPVVARVSGTSAESFATEIQLAHPRPETKNKDETVRLKNSRLREAGAHVPDSFETFGELLGKVYSFIGEIPLIDGSYEEEQVRSNLKSIEHRRVIVS